VLLAIDTSTELAGLALYDGDIRAELTWVAGRRHSVQLLPQVASLLDLVGLELESLTALAAARGPGSFTGVRVGLAAAQGLALALNIPVFGVGSLDVLAAGQEATELPIRPLLHVGRGRFATALYQKQAGRLAQQEEMRGVALADLGALVDERCLICGDLDRANRTLIRDMLGERVALASPAGSLRRPGVLAQLGWEQLSAGEAGEPSALQPLYLSG